MRTGNGRVRTVLTGMKGGYRGGGQPGGGAHAFGLAKQRGGGRLMVRTCGVEPDHEDAHLLLPEEAVPELGERKTHCAKNLAGRGRRASDTAAAV